ncbi:MAG: DNA gyrase C-terminal beta-propeller domain-containing protein, partial [Pseudomonadota bacterium]
SPSPAEAREALLAARWLPGEVTSMLERAGAEACRPDDLDPSFGLHDGEYRLSPAQAQAILDLRLHRLTGLEHEKLLKEYQDKLAEIADLLDILQDPERLLAVIREELEDIATEFGDERRTEIRDSQEDLTAEDLITPEDRVVTLSHGGYAKTQPLGEYQVQRRGGMGKAALTVKDEDFVEHLLIANTHDTLLCFTNLGKVYWLKVYMIPVAGRTSRGRPMVNLLQLDEGERVTSILPLEEPTENRFIFMATARGFVKKTDLASFAPRSAGLRAILLEEGDVLVGTAITDGASDVMLLSSEGKAMRFREDEVRPMGRASRGVRGINLADGHNMISLLIPDARGTVLTVSENGYGKRTAVEDFPTKGRAGKGVIAMATSERNGKLVGALQVFSGDELMLISSQGTLVRTAADEVSQLGRNTQGVRIIRTKAGETLVRVERIADSSADEAAAGSPTPGDDESVNATSDGGSGDGGNSSGGTGGEADGNAPGTDDTVTGGGDE